MKDIETIVSDNIKKLLAERNLNQSELAKIADVSESTVGKWVLKKSAPRMGAIERMANYFDLPKSYILEEPKASNIIEVSQRTVRIPVLGIISCGDPILAEENYEDYRIELEDRLPTGKLFYLEAKGDSMHPEITDGSMVLLREQADVENGEIAAVMVNGNTEATLKRVKKQGDMIILMPENSDYEPIFVTKDSPAQIIGKVVRSERKH